MKLLGTDSRLRNDIRILENGDQESAEKEKAIVEANQRGTCKHFIRTTDADTGEEYH